MTNQKYTAPVLSYVKFDPGAALEASTKKLLIHRASTMTSALQPHSRNLNSLLDSQDLADERTTYPQILQST
ncbi:uncharacterized protein N7503_012104 [Penicillium pulvis]|uniref:uncharacterized protein n=1 Tax=Penicillium pulvis TaxID=1562058 RepID=UPI00254703BA|nr:uncharacterized protein N7503_012104 [Penicillium pulvis]KAJ5786892.1 hypothetical protein N7503_012104 [Penicillium pulvis]